MKRALPSSVFFFLITFPFNVSAQKTLPDSHVNIGVGAGMNYGLYGVKTVIGYRNTGLLIGLGTGPRGLFGYEIGAQIAKDDFYLNFGYGVSSGYQLNDGPMEPVKSMGILIGGMISLDKKRNVFLDLGIGHTLGAPTVDMGGYFNESQDSFIFALGVGFRLLKKKE